MMSWCWGTASAPMSPRRSRGRSRGSDRALVEVDAKFVEGNSGSPIIHVKTGKVIGIATFALKAEPGLTFEGFAIRGGMAPLWLPAG